MALEFLQKIFQIFCPSLIDINLRSTQKIRNQIGKNLCSACQICINRESEPMSAKNIDVTDSPDSANTILKTLRLKNVNCLICAQLNINSIRNKFESLKEIASTNVDILLICETKLDSSFPRAQFHIHGFGDYRFDRNGRVTEFYYIFEMIFRQNL